MGLDIYAGTLTRYYSHNWKTSVQRWAEENGYTFSKVTPDGTPVSEDSPDPAEVERDVKEWRDTLLKVLSPEDGAYAPWDEDNYREYFTAKPDWDAFGALLLYGACLLYEEECPKIVQKGMDFYAHPVLKRAMEEETLNWSLYIGAEWWIPLQDTFSFQCQNPCGNPIVMGTTGTLLAELDRINSMGWKADQDIILSWSSTEGYPQDGQITADGMVNPLKEVTEYDTNSLAKFAFSILYEAALFSMDNRVPILLDY